jgi:transcriptional regulator with XRE-family HTH domain
MTNKADIKEITITPRKLAIFSSNVARQRKAAGMSKTEFAASTTVSRDTIRRIETRPEGYIPSIDSIVALAELAGTSVQGILTTRLQF